MSSLNVLFDILNYHIQSLSTLEVIFRPQSDLLFTKNYFKNKLVLRPIVSQLSGPTFQRNTRHRDLIPLCQTTWQLRNINFHFSDQQK